MTVGMTRAEMRTMVAGLRLAHALVSGEDPESQFAQALGSLTKRLSVTGKLTREETEKIRDICDGFLNRHEDRLRKVARDEIAVEMEDAQIKKTHHPSIDPTPARVMPAVRQTPRASARPAFPKATRGDWSKVYDDFYAVVETSMYVPNPTLPRFKNLPEDEKNNLFLGWVASQKEYTRFFNEDRALVLGKGLRIWRQRFGLAPLTPKAGNEEIDRYFREFLPTVPRKKKKI